MANSEDKSKLQTSRYSKDKSKLQEWIVVGI